LRGEKSLDHFYAFLGDKSSKNITLAVMDMWKAFRNPTERQAFSGAGQLFLKIETNLPHRSSMNPHHAATNNATQ